MSDLLQEEWVEKLENDDNAFILDVRTPEGNLPGGEIGTLADLNSTSRRFLKPISTTNPPISAIPHETKKTESYPHASVIKPLGRAPMLLEAESITEMMAM